MNYARFLLVLLSVLLVNSVIVASAQENDGLTGTHVDRISTDNSGLVTRLAYYIASDEDGIQQVFQLVLDGDINASRQITRAVSDVLTYGIAYDGLAVAYISDRHLWLQPVHTEEPESLASINTDNIFGRPVFSQDGQYIAYTDNGVWLVDLSTRETRRLVQDVPLTEGATNAEEFRIYSPELFVLGNDGDAAWLVLDIGIWEWNSAGLYDLRAGELQMIDDVLYTDLLPLYGGRALIYGNNALDGEPVLRAASDLNTIETFDEVLNFSGLIENVTLFADQAVEIAPGTVRVFGSMFGAAWDFNGRFYFDYNLMEKSPIAVNMLPLPLSETGVVETGPLSPDGELVPIYLDTIWTETGSKSGQVVIMDVATSEEVVTLEGTVSAFQWQP